MPTQAPIVNGWRLHGHPLFLDQFEALTNAVATARAKEPDAYKEKRPAKLLAALVRLVADDIPADPAAPKYRQGDTLGRGGSHWFRAKFFQQYRLFFRFNSRAKIIIFAWGNDDDTKRAREV